RRQITLELVQRARPAPFVAVTGLLGLQLLVGESELGPTIDRPQIDGDARYLVTLVRFTSDRPLPGHDQALGIHDLEVLAPSLMLDSVQIAKPHPEAAADTCVDVGNQNGAVIGAPPVSNALRGAQSCEYDRWSCADSAH